MNEATSLPREVEFDVEIMQPVVDGIPSLVEHLNMREGAEGDAAQSELVVQREIVALLKVRLPCPSLVRQNEIVVRDEDGACIPDIIIDRIGGGCWAVIELKVHFEGGRLSQARVERDFEKLCRYKGAHPSAHCIFLVVGKAAKRERSLETVSRSMVRLRSKEARGSQGGMISNWLRGHPFYTARSCAVGQYRTAIEAKAWEVVPIAHSQIVERVKYRFNARMRE